MATAAALGGLEIRAGEDGNIRLTGRFPFNAVAVLAPGRSEIFAPGSLEPRSNVFLLSQHRFETPLASTGAGTLDLRSDGEGLHFEARISPEVAETSHAKDALALIRSGLVAGLSPGFKIVNGGERVERRDGGLLRTVTRAELHELSVVTRPAFAEASVEARGRPWAPTAPTNATYRWR